MAKQTELSISYSVGVKVNIGNYESADVHLSRSEKWECDVTEADALYTERHAALKSELDTLIQNEYQEMK